MSFENIPKLITKEDHYHLHKTLGILSLGHFAYRFYHLIHGSMNFTTTYDISYLGLHFLLSSTSLNFKIPLTRNQAGPMIYPEFRLHNILFSYRSILCTLFFYYEFSILYNILTCYFTMLCADIVTLYYKDGTTMRNMKFDSSMSENAKKEITAFNSRMQLYATMYMLGNVDSAFSPLFAIQFASFLMTLVRKNIIKNNHWHILYGLSLMANILVCYSLPLDFILFQIFAIRIFLYLRFTKHYSKYMSWTMIYSLFLMYRQYPYTLPYENTIKNIIIIGYTTNIYMYFIT